AQRDAPAALVLERVHLLVALRAALTEQDLLVLEGRRIDRREAVRAVDAPRDVDERLARQHRFGQVVAEAAQRARLDALIFRPHGGSRPAKRGEDCRPPGRTWQRNTGLDQSRMRGKMRTAYSASCCTSPGCRRT